MMGFFLNLAALAYYKYIDFAIAEMAVKCIAKMRPEVMSKPWQAILSNPLHTGRPLIFVIILNGYGYAGQPRDKILSTLKDRFTKAPQCWGIKFAFYARYFFGNY